MAPSDIKAEISDTKGRVKRFRNATHAWAALNPFTFGTITGVIGLLIGMFFF